jgi:DNA-binding response OmpR family regulator
VKRKILLVEDDDDLRRGLGMRLVAWGYEVLQAPDGYYAVEVARKELPDLVILDIGLPGGDGLTVLERYSKCMQMGTIPVVVLTGRDPFTTEPVVREYANVIAFLRKPAENDELARVLSDALGGPPHEEFAEFGRQTRPQPGGRWTSHLRPHHGREPS